MIASLFGSALDTVIRNKVCFTTKNGFDQRMRFVCFYCFYIMRLIPNSGIALPLAVHTVMLAGIQSICRRFFQIPVFLEAFKVRAPLLHIFLSVIVLAAGKVKVRYSKQISMIRKCESGHLKINCTLNHIVHAGSGIQNGKIRVVMKMYKCHVFSFVSVLSFLYGENISFLGPSFRLFYYTQNSSFMSEIQTYVLSAER